MQMYHFGFAKALQVCGVHNCNVRYAGSSAGSLASSALIADCDFDLVREYACECAISARSSIGNAFRIRDFIKGAVQRFASAAYKENPELRHDLNRQLEVYISILPWCTQKVVTRFDTLEDLEEALIASCCITPLAGWPFQLRETKEWACDGGLTAFQPRNGEAGVITVNPVYFTRADIKPSAFVPAWWGLYPPDDANYRFLYDLGFNDTVSFLVQRRLVAPSKLALLREAPGSPTSARPIPFSPAAPAPEGAIDAAASAFAGVNYPGRPRGRKGLLMPAMTAFEVTRDFAALLFFFLVLRPWAMLFIYLEMIVVSVSFLGMAAVSDGVNCARAVLALIVSVVRFKRVALRDAWKSHERWRETYHSARNVLSARVMLHVLVFGQKIPINTKRLEKFSRLYRVLRPMLYANYQY